MRRALILLALLPGCAGMWASVKSAAAPAGGAGAVVSVQRAGEVK